MRRLLVNRRTDASLMRAARAGFTLVELMLSVTMLVIAIGIAIPFFLAQNRALAAHAGRMDAQLNVNFGLDAIDRDLRVAGVGTVARQPLIVQAASDAMTFNVDLTSNISTDFGTVYYDPDAAAGTVGLLWPANKVTLPNSSWTYPDSAYYASAGVPGSAETISYWIESDPQSPGLYRLMRRVNDATPRVLSRGIRKTAGDPFFRYFKLGVTGALTEIAQSSLPIRHVNGYHGGPADTAASALTDSIELVAIRFTGVHRDPRSADVDRTEERSVSIANAGLIHVSTCGDAPLAPGGVSVAATLTPSVDVTWNASTDEAAGETDVERYALYRRAAGAPTFGEPIGSVAAGLASYLFTDTNVKPGEQWVYGVAAQDCSPAVSSVLTSAMVVIP
jgi:type II secretory pathway pseudopilin PulG